MLNKSFCALNEITYPIDFFITNLCRTFLPFTKTLYEIVTPKAGKIITD